MSMLAELDPRHWIESIRSQPSTWPLPETAIPVLIRGLGDRKTDVRKTAARVLGGYGTLAAPAVPALTVALDDWSPEVQQEATQALLKIGTEARAAVPALRELLGHGNRSVAGSAANALKTLVAGEGSARGVHFPVEASPPR